jgi:hypothetical protein
MVGSPGLFLEESEWSDLDTAYRLRADGWVGSGDVAWELAVTVVSIVFLVTRYLERRFIGR